jgi:hypothetical protein
MPLEVAMTTASPRASHRPSWARRRAGVGRRSVHEFEGGRCTGNDAERRGSFEVLKRQVPHLYDDRQTHAVVLSLQLVVVGVRVEQGAAAPSPAPYRRSAR